MNELVHLRTRLSKTFDRPRAPLEQLLAAGGEMLVKRRTLVSALGGAIHWHDGKEWQDVDLSWRLSGGKYVVPSASYEVDFDPQTYTLHYRSRTNGDMSVRLVSIDGEPPVVVEPQISPGGDRLRFVGVAAGVILILIARPNGPEIMRRIDGPSLPEIVWEVDESADRGALASNLMEMAGLDNAGLSSEARKAEVLVRNQSRIVDLRITKSPEITVDGRRQYTVTEQLTGRTRWRNPETRVPEWVAEQLVFPVLIDVLVSEGTSADADDGTGAFGTWYTGTVNFTNVNAPGWRFQTVDIPQGATIDDATLRVSVATDGDSSGPLTGNDVDDAGVWASSAGNVPQSMIQTTATTPFGNFGGTGDHDILITEIVQEIVDRAGWVSGNDMRFAVPSRTSGTGQVIMHDFSYSPSFAGRLIVNYTVGGGGAPMFRGA